RATDAVTENVGQAAGMETALAAFGVCEIVDENMAAAARVHAVEWGKDIAARAMIAFGGAAPLHAARLAEKLDIDEIIVPTGAGVGSAIGFLRAPISYEVVRSRYLRLADFDAATVDALLGEMRAEAHGVVDAGAGGAATEEHRVAFMRYVGQGHEIAVPLPDAGSIDADSLRAAFAAEYTRLFGRTIPGQDLEILSWTLTVSAEIDSAANSAAMPAPAGDGAAIDQRPLFDPATTDFVDAPVYWRENMAVGASVAGPALIAEDQTTTVVTAAFTAHVDARGYLRLRRQS
ncbi:MAG: hydantoinase/oxoprolinase family protein, partial [Pseudomonadota bacterium]|nr:hydantoinase/oxoprolinase family protein [Pseudomonadota bacterium]